MKLFVGLEIPDQARIAIERRTEPLKRSLPHASWVSASNYHLLLAFLGERDESQLGALGGSLSAAFASREPFEIQLGRGGAFPPLRRARVLWVGVDREAELERLHQTVWASLKELVDLEEDWRPFHPHLTVARCRKPWTRRCVDVWCRSCSGPVGRPFEVRRGALFCSEAGQDGIHYRGIESYPFKELH